MPGFTFSQGNLRKGLSAPLYVLGSIASLFVPRSSERWVIGSGTGVGEGARELAIFAHAANPSLKIVWLGKNEADLADARALGIPSVHKDSFQGFRLTLRAGVVAVTHGFGDANRFGERGAFIVQLWHGVPLKLIQLDSPATTRITGFPGAWRLRGTLRRFYRRGYRAIGLIPAASELVAERLRTAFGVAPSIVAVTGDPRDDVLSRGSTLERSTAARETLEALIGDAGQVILYAPTWREGDPDPSVPSAEEWLQIDASLKASGSVLLVRPHPHGVGDYRDGVESSERVRMFGSDLIANIMPILPAVDVLITDYSSIAFDFALTGGDILFLAPDQDHYAETRGLYEPYREFSGGREVTTWPALLDQLDRLSTDPGFAGAVSEHSVRLADRHFAYRDGHNTERVYSEILRRLKANR